MRQRTDLLLTALAPAVWGSTYIVTTELLPPGLPLTVATLRALPAGLLLLLLVRRLPSGVWWGRALLLGALNFSFFWALLFVAAYRLPGGVAATVGAVQPLIVVLLARAVLGTPVRAAAVPTPSDRRLARACDVLIASPGEAHGLEELATVAGASVRTLARLAREELGCPLSVWRQQARVLAAVPLLVAGRSVTATAQELGYETSSAFAAVFRRFLGTTPREFVSRNGA